MERETVQFEIPKRTLKHRRDNFVLYDVDYLLDHLSMEVYLLETYRQNKKKHPQVDYESVLSEVRKLSAEDFKGVNNET